MLYAKFAKKHNNLGFTLIELLVVIAIVAVLGLVSIGPTLRWRANKQIESNANTIISSLERAKLEAIRRSKNVSITFDSGTDGGNRYDFRIFTDTNGNRLIDGTDQVLLSGTMVVRVQHVISTNGLIMTVPSAPTDAHRGFTFNPRGFLVRANMGTIVLDMPNSHTSLQRTITINRIGNVSSTVTE